MKPRQKVEELVTAEDFGYIIAGPKEKAASFDTILAKFRCAQVIIEEDGPGSLLGWNDEDPRK